MSKTDDYRVKLKELRNWKSFLLKNSGLPGPRGNLELAKVVAEEGTKVQFEEFLSLQADENTPEVFVVFCGIVGLGKLAAQGEHQFLIPLRSNASDPRWRIREGVATALQYIGDKDMNLLLREMQVWSLGNWYEKRAAAAALAEPRLLKEPRVVNKVLQILDRITDNVNSAESPKDEAFKVLRQGLGYCWSVAVAAFPKEGKPVLEKWLLSKNPDVHWIMKENLKKNRLVKMDPVWVKRCLSKL
jgi:hypothetical protein